MGLAIRLLGKPAIERDGAPVSPPRGRKAWGLLAYLVICERPPTRAHLASLLFGEADDPLGALRWSLAELRRALGDPLALRGDPPVLHLPAGTAIDALALIRPRLGPVPAAWEAELLEGMDFRGCAAFESWLAYERRHLAGACQGLLHEAALERLAIGDTAEACALAARLVALDPLEQRSQELLIRSLARHGDSEGAQRQLAACEALLERELGASPGPELRLAAGERAGAPAGAAGDRSAALGQLEAGRAALDAGAVEPGVECLRLACAEASACGDHAVHARCLATLGSALVHAVRGRDEEGAARLHEALAIADRAGERATAALACRELGYVDVQAGRGGSAGVWLARATELAASDEEMCAVLGVRGMALSDRAYYPAALELLDRSAALAGQCGRTRQAAWSLSLVGRIPLLRGELEEALDALDRSLELVAGERWTAFRPWPEALRAEAALLAGRQDDALEGVESAFRLACRLGDPCWEAMAARVRGLVRAGAGDPAGALDWLGEAKLRATRVSDPYEWVHAQVLDTLTTLALDAGDPRGRGAAQELEELAARAGMREFVVRARVHQARLGVLGALEAARLIAADIDNAALDGLLAECQPA